MKKLQDIDCKTGMISSFIIGAILLFITVVISIILAKTNPEAIIPRYVSTIAWLVVSSPWLFFLYFVVKTPNK